MSFFHSHSFSRCLSTVAFALITAFTANAQIVIPSSGYINTIAGNGTQGTSGNGGPALNAELNWLGGVALDGSGNLFILDTCTVREVSAQTGDISVVVGNGTCGYSGDGGPAIDAEINTYFYNKFLGPVPQGGIATDALGNLYIADARNSRLRKVNMQTGIITTIAGSSIGGYSGDGGPANNAVLNGPSALTLDSQGNIYWVLGSKALRGDCF